MSCAGQFDGSYSPYHLDTDTLDSRYTATVPQLAGTTGQKPATRSHARAG